VPLQVIGGEFGGRRLKSPPAGVRPTAAILRRSLFDILGPRVVDATVLDLYAGAGTLGVEALSRGAARVDFVERDGRACAVIRENLEALGAEAAARRGRVDCAPAEKWLQRHVGLEAYDLVLADPPYGDAGVTRVLSLLVETGALRPGGLAVLETRRGTAAEPVDGLVEVRRVRHGDSELRMLEPAG
jgi:16S rRNA (guanine966-N2)-methyltransferase